MNLRLNYYLRRTLLPTVSMLSAYSQKYDFDNFASHIEELKNSTEQTINVKNYEYGLTSQVFSVLLFQIFHDCVRLRKLHISVC